MSHIIERRGVQVDLSYEHKQACPPHGNIEDMSHFVGQIFDGTEVISVFREKKSETSKHYTWFFVLKCKCGGEFVQQKNRFESGKKMCQQCSRVPNLVGKTFGKLSVIGFDRMEKNNSFWICRCECGDTVSVRARNLPNTKSCGCEGIKVLTEKATTHGQSDTRTYRAWKGAVGRATNRNSSRWEDYGGRGITVCARWSVSEGGSFENFLEDMGECPDGYTLDRINVNDGYYKENCRWTTRCIQQVNRRGTNNTSGRIGVSLCPTTGKWRARLRFEGQTYWLGRFSSFEEACAVVTEKEAELHGCVRANYDN